MRANRSRSFRLPRGIWIILLLAVLLRCGWLFYARPVPVLDFRDYRELAERMVNHHAYLNRDLQPTALRLPGYPFFLACLMVISKSDLWLGLGAVLLSASLCLPVYYFSRIVSAKKNELALCAAAICAFYPPYVFYSPVLASEPLEAALVLWSLVVLFFRARLSVSRSLAAGFLMAAAALTRGSSLFFIPIAAAMIFLIPIGRVKKQLIRCLIFLAACLIPLAAWWARTRILIGPGVGLSTQGGINFYYAHNPDNYGWRACLANTSSLWKLHDEDKMSREGYRLGWMYLIQSPAFILNNIKISSKLLYSIPKYSCIFSTKSNKKGKKGGFLCRKLAFLPWARNLNTAAYAFFFSLVVLSILRWSSIPKIGIILIFLLLAAHWFFYAVIFHGAPRYGYIIYVFLFPLAALSLATMLPPKLHRKHST